MVEFHRTLSERTVYFRYFGMLSLSHRIQHERLARVCRSDDPHEVVLVVDHRQANESHEIIGVARLSRFPESRDAEFAIVLSDRWHGLGIGTRLLTILVQVATQEGVARVTGHILAENIGMRDVANRAGFDVQWDADEGEWKANIACARPPRERSRESDWDEHAA